MNSTVDCRPFERHGLVLSSRTGTGLEGQQNVGYAPFAEPSVNHQYLRIAVAPGVGVD